MQEGSKNIQIWYRNELDGKTFELNNPIVEVYETAHDAAWYSTNQNGGNFSFYFWNNVLSDGTSIVNYQSGDPNYTYVFYIDADPACGQYGGLGAAGVVVISANDLRGLSGQPWIPICPGENFDYTPCRYVGGLGHELGHAFGLPHPPGCDQGESSCDFGSIMWTGLYDYPNCHLNSEEKEILNQNPFFKPINLTSLLPNCDVLPVELTFFTANLFDNNVELNWQTATEINNYGFDIERKHEPQTLVQPAEWQKIGFIQGYGNSNISHSYNFADKNLLPGNYFYRLKQIDIDGRFEYSNTIKVTVKSNLAFEVEQNYPNPFNSSTVIRWHLAVGSHVSLKVYDILGNEVVTLVNGFASAGDYNVKFDTEKMSVGKKSLPSGIYFYKLSAGGFIKVKKMNLQR